MKKIFLLVSSALLLTAISCDNLKPLKVDVIHLGIIPDSIVIPADAGEDGVPVISDRDYMYEIVSGADWIERGVCVADSLSFIFKANEGFRRSAILRISADGRSDELQVKQEGVYAQRLSLSISNVNAPVGGCSVTARVLSNLPTDYFTTFVSDEEAIAKVRLEDSILSFEVLPTTNRDVRNYSVSVLYTDDWGDELSASITIKQEAYH